MEGVLIYEVYYVLVIYIFLVFSYGDIFFDFEGDFFYMEFVVDGEV